MRAREFIEHENRIPEYIDVDGVSRTTTNSNGKLIHQTKEGIENFWKWFGDSKIVDKQGRPLVCYHKTTEDFDAFSDEKHGKNDYGYAGKGFYFMPFPLQGFTYGNITMPVYLSIQNPYIRTNDNWEDSDVDPYNWIPKQGFENRHQAAIQWTNLIKKAGYDGFRDIAGDGNGEIVAFSAHQIKSVSGNVGTYSRDNPSITNEGVPNAGKFVIDPGFSKFYNDDDEDEGRVLVKINVPNFDAAWRTGSSKNQYIGHHGLGGTKNRYEKFGQWLATANEPIQASTVGVDEHGNVSFYNGRHRYCYLRDHGVKTILVAMDPHSVRHAKRFNLIDTNFKS